MLWSDRIWHWLVSLGGLALMGCGVVLIAFVHPVLPHLHVAVGRVGGLFVGLGFCVFVLGFPSQAQRNGYRHL